MEPAAPSLARLDARLAEISRLAASMRAPAARPASTTARASAAPATARAGLDTTGFAATFERMLDATTSPGAAGATAGAGAAGLTPALRLAPGTYGPLSVPADVARYGNGRLPASALAGIGQANHVLQRDAAAAFRTMAADARRAGLDLRVSDSYRSYEAQVATVARRGRYDDGGFAADPGTSPHGWGLAVDLDTTNPAALAWMRQNAWRYGFAEDVAREPWHFTYRPTTGPTSAPIASARTLGITGGITGGI